MMMRRRIAGGLDQMTFKGPFQHKPFHNSVMMKMMMMMVVVWMEEPYLF